MVPPPGGSTGDEFPDFDKMTFEEQMAWLESLAKRQGAKSEELTTAANVDIPVPTDATVDEPGYVPFEGSRSAREAKEGRATQPVPTEPEPEAASPVEAWAEAGEQAEQPAEEAVSESMGWLDSISAQPDEGEIEGDLFAAAASGEESLDWGDLESAFADLESPAAEPAVNLDFLAEAAPELDLFGEELPSPDAGSAEPALNLDFLAEAAPELDLFGEELPSPDAGTAQPAEEDFLGGADPMQWLETLAARQGVSADQLTTSADLEIEEVSGDVEIDEPGYVPFEGSRSARETAETVAPPAEAEAEALAEDAEAAALFDWDAAEPIELAAFDAQTGDEVEDLLDGADPMAWLETLARRQGVSPEELLTSADEEIREVPADAVVEEPGYEPYSPLDILPPSRAEAARVEPVEEPVEEFAAPEAGDDALSWLEDLVAEPESLSEYIAVEREAPPEPEPATPLEATPSDDPLVGMTDEDIAYAQAHHQLTGEQELAWLKRQAAKLAEIRQQQEAMPVLEDLPPAEMTQELPSWIQEMQPGEEAEPEVEEEIELGTAPDVSGWLEDIPPEGEPALWEPVTTSPNELSLGPIESLWPEATEEQGFLDEPPAALETWELDEFVKGVLVPHEPDPLAEALDAEYERRLVGDESEPEWYTDVVRQAAQEAPPIPEIEATGEPAQAEAEAVQPAEAQPDEMPGWLVESGTAPAAEIDSSMPDWLKESPEITEPVASEEVPGWLQDVPPAEPSEEMPEWLQAETARAEPEPVSASPEPVEPPAPPPPPPAPPRPAPVATVVEPEFPPAPRPVAVPPGELFEEYRRRLDENPNDHPNRLALARALRGSRELASSLDQYETLIDSSQLLQDVADDLTELVRQSPNVPRTHRLLGDAYMRRGMLQEALDSYRSALDQL